METELILPIIMRWLHIFAAIIAVGGIIFQRFVLMPAANAALGDDIHDQLRAKVVGRWQKFVHVCILLFLVSGFYNYLVLTAPMHEGQSLYHALFGVKFLLALVVFLLAIVLTSRQGYAERFRKNAKLWLGLLALLAIIIVLISGVMKNIPVTV